MDTQHRQTLWAIALEHEEAAELCAQREWHNVSVACSYYAVYTTMWLALDDPPHGQWSHAGILQQFAPGRWRQPPAPLDRIYTRAIRRLYHARIHSQYRGEQLTSLDSEDGLRTAQQVISLVAETFGFSYGRGRP